MRLLHSVSVITNFVIPKRDKQSKTSHFLSTAGARPTILTILGTVIEEVRTIFEPLNLFLIQVVSSLGAVENLMENACNLVFCFPKATELKT